MDLELSVVEAIAIVLAVAGVLVLARATPARVAAPVAVVAAVGVALGVGTAAGASVVAAVVGLAFAAGAVLRLLAGHEDDIAPRADDASPGDDGDVGVRDDEGFPDGDDGRRDGDDASNRRDRSSPSAAAERAPESVAVRWRNPDGLTPREVDVLALVAAGHSNAEIAAELHISAATVKTHINHVFAKTGVRDRAQAVVYAYDQGLSAPPTG